MPKDFKDGKWKVMVAVQFAGDEETDMMHSQRAILTFPQKVAEEEEEEE